MRQENALGVTRFRRGVRAPCRALTRTGSGSGRNGDMVQKYGVLN
jgi:hypothetical protein